MLLPSLTAKFLVGMVSGPKGVHCPVHATGLLTSEATAPERNTVLLRIFNFHGESRLVSDPGRCSGRKH